MEGAELMTENPQFIIKQVKAHAGALELLFKDGERGTVDMKQAVGGLRAVRGILNPLVFPKARAVDLGRSVAWPGDENWELAADTLRAHMIEQQGGFSHANLIEWMARNDLTLDQAAVELGMSRRMLAYYRNGSKPIPRTVALACSGWEHQSHALQA